MKISVVDADELAELEDLDDAELIRRVRDGFQKFRARDAAGSGLGARELEENDQPNADDPPPTPGTPRPPERNGGRLNAQDRAAVRGAGIAASHALDELAIRQRGGANMDGELLALRARQSGPVDPRVVEVIPGYSRLK
jgi:hypothetical protein